MVILIIFLKFTTQQNNFEYPLYQAFQFVFIIENIITANNICYFFIITIFSQLISVLGYTGKRGITGRATKPITR